MLLLLQRSNRRVMSQPAVTITWKGSEELLRFVFETDFLIVVSNICILISVLFLAVALRKTAVGRYLRDWPVSRIPSTPVSDDNSFSAAKGFTGKAGAGSQLPPLNLWKKLEQAESEGNKSGMKKTPSSRIPHSHSSTPGTDYVSTAGGSSTAGSPVKYWVEPKSPPGSPPSPSVGYWETGYSATATDNPAIQRGALTGDALIKESCNNPALLIGWQIEVHGRGHGVIIGMKRTYSRPTKFLVQFENGQNKLLKLKRSDKKGGLAFSPIKMAHAL